jgi:hypothetical protein
MEPTVVAKTNSRSVVGTLNEFTHQIRWALESDSVRSLHDLSLWLARTPILALDDFPDRMTRRVFGIGG